MAGLDNSRPSAWALKSRRVTARDKTRSWSPVGTVQDRSTLPLRSVLGVCHWQTAPEAAAETAALGRRGFGETVNKRPALELGGDKEKFCQLFQKLRLVRRSLTALNRRSHTKNPGAKAARARKGDRLALRPFRTNNEKDIQAKNLDVLFSSLLSVRAIVYRLRLV